MEQGNHTTIVRTLIGHQQMREGLQCLASLLNHSADPLSLVIHDDGTLTSEDCETLVSALPDSRVLAREETDSVVLPRLARHPKSIKYRQSHPLGLKLIDIALFEAGDLAYCDSDVFFLRPYARLFKWPDERTAGIFMQDIQDAYSLRPWHIYPFGNIRIPRRVNSGLIRFRGSSYDLDFIEWMLSRERLSDVFGKRPHWIEQTCWAALGWRAGCRLWSDRQFMIATPSMKGLSDETIAIHFVAACRGKLNTFSTRSEASTSAKESPVNVRSSPAVVSSPLRMLAQDLVNRLRLN